MQTGNHTGKVIGEMYFQRPAYARAEVSSVGFTDVRLHGVIGPCWAIRNLDEAWAHAHQRETILRVVRLLDGEESLLGFSTHYITISRKA